MKHRSLKPIMRYFTPELYIRFNSPDDDVADAANEAWENALEDYQNHLASFRDKMPSQVRKLSELCLHDAEVLSFEMGNEILAIVSLKQDANIRSLFYMLWDRVRQYPFSGEWAFSKLRKSWLYDEVDVAPDQHGLFLHRVLFSDGSVVEIPFVSVVVEQKN